MAPGTLKLLGWGKAHKGTVVSVGSLLGENSGCPWGAFSGELEACGLTSRTVMVLR